MNIAPGTVEHEVAQFEQKKQDIVDSLIDLSNLLQRGLVRIHNPSSPIATSPRSRFQQQQQIQYTFTDSPAPTTVVKGLGLQYESYKLHTEADRIDDGLFTAVVIGNSSTGKTSLVNCLLRQTLLPLSLAPDRPSTAVITMVVKGDPLVEPVVVHKRDAHASERIPLAKFVTDYQLRTETDWKDVQERGYSTRHSDVIFAQVPSQSRLCHQGIKIVDTPGIDINSHTLTSVALNWLARNRAVILVIDGRKLIHRYQRGSDLASELKLHLIQPHIAELKRSLFFVINMWEGLDHDPHVRDKVIHNAFCMIRSEFYNGEDDAEAENRVFFVNLKWAYDEVRVHGSHVNKTPEYLPRTGLFYGGLETRIKNFFMRLNLNEFFGSTATVAQHSMATANLWLHNERFRLEHVKKPGTMDELRHLQNRMQYEIQGLEDCKAQIQQAILAHHTLVSEALKQSWDDLLFDMHAKWPKDSQTMFAKVKLSSMVISSLALSSGPQQEVLHELRDYFAIKLLTWASSVVPGVIKQYFEDLLDDLIDRFDRFQQLLRDLECSFYEGRYHPTASLHVPFHKGSYPEHKEAIRIAQLAMWSNLDPTRLSAGLSSAQQAKAFGIRILPLQTVSGVILDVLSGPIAKIPSQLFKGVLTAFSTATALNDLRQNIGKHLFERLEEQAPIVKQAIQVNVQRQFKYFANDIVGADLSMQISQARAMQEDVYQECMRVINQPGGTAVKEQYERIELLETELKLCVDRLNSCIPGFHYSEERPTKVLTG